MNIIFISPPAAGKGTQSKLLSEEYNIPHISAGDLLRDEVASGSELGKELKAIMDAGKLVSLEDILKLLENRLSKDDCKNGYILDGYPRDMAQAKAYEGLLEKLNMDLGHVIFLDIEKELAVKRTLSRLICPNCGSSYNLVVEEAKPKREGICDRCSHELKQRSDDNEETILKRFDTYMENTKDLIDYYKNLGVLTSIKVLENKTVNDIFNEIKEVIND